MPVLFKNAGILLAALLCLAGGLACGGAAEVDSGESGGSPAEPAAAISEPVEPGEPMEPADGVPDAADTVSFENPGGTPVPLATASNPGMAAAPAGDIEWTAAPTLSQWELSAEGILPEGAVLFEPMAEEDAAFAVYYKGHTEPMVVLLPDLGPMHVWDTDETIATMEMEAEGRRFEFTAASPLFGDAGNLELHVRGYNAEGEAGILAVVPIQ